LTSQGIKPFMSSTIPAPEYISEIVDSSVYQLPDVTALLVGSVLPTLANQRPIISGILIVRYGLTLLIPAGIVMIPGLFAAEKGGMLVGREAWDFMQGNFTMHPRADVVGMGIDGTMMQALVREIDFGVPVRVFVYASIDSKTPAAEVTQLIVSDNAPPVPDLLTRYLRIAQ
jgi:hypothetical protein